MRDFIIAAAMAATNAIAFAPATAEAQTRDERRIMRDCQHDLRDADNRREVRRERRDCRQERRETRRQTRDYRTYRNYDYNRYEPGANGYYAENYYRDGSSYRERRLTRNDRIYRGNNGQYYCRRPDGTTGLIIGGAVGALLGNQIDNGRSSVLGTLIGGGAGALLGREVERGGVRCR